MVQRRRLLNDSDAQGSSPSTDGYLLRLSGVCRQTLSWKEVKKLPAYYDEPAKCCSIGDSHRSPGFDRDGIWTEHRCALLISDDTDESRGASAHCLSVGAG